MPGHAGRYIGACTHAECTILCTYFHTWLRLSHARPSSSCATLRLIMADPSSVIGKTLSCTTILDRPPQPQPGVPTEKRGLCFFLRTGPQVRRDHCDFTRCIGDRIVSVGCDVVMVVFLHQWRVIGQEMYVRNGVTIVVVSVCRPHSAET